MRIEVTQEDIDQGVRCDTDNCPVALAIGRQFKDCFAVLVGDANAAVFRFYHDERSNMTRQTRSDFPLPQEAKTFVVDYDAGEEVAPFAFEVSF